MKRKDCRSILSEKLLLISFFKDMDQKDKDEFRKLDEDHQRKVLEMDKPHLDRLKSAIFNRRYELDHHVVSLTPDLWGIDMLVDEEYHYYSVDKAIAEIQSQDEKPKRRFLSRKNRKI